MRWAAVGAVAVGCVVVAGCGDGVRSAGPGSSDLHTGTTSQGLVVSLDAGGGHVDRLAIAWVGRCRGRGSPTSGDTGQLHPEEFYPGQLPVTVDDQRREDATDGDRSTHLRHLEVRAEGGSYTGRLRVRTRVYNGQGRGVDALCDSGDISFSTKPVGAPQVPAVSATRAQFRDADFHERMYEALRALASPIQAGDATQFCVLVTKRLARTYCKKGRKATADRIARELHGLPDLLEENKDPARRSGRQAVVIVQTFEGRSGPDGTPEEHAVHTLRFKPSGDRDWRLDDVGPKRWVVGPP